MGNKNEGNKRMGESERWLGLFSWLLVSLQANKTHFSMQSAER
jgi:hypothetical protein